MRVAGLYGPNRSALHTLCKHPAALKRARKDHCVTSRIHRDDAVRALLNAPSVHIQQGHCEVFNVADDCPESRCVVFEHAAKLLSQMGINTPQDDIASNVTVSDAASDRDRVRTSKRVCNDKLKALLLPTLLYPSYVEGLRSIAEQEQTALQDIASRVV